MGSLRGRRILVLEDEYHLAKELERILDVEGAIVIGPMSALDQVKHVPLDMIDAAILDVRVRDGMTFTLAAQLRDHGIPFVFASGQERGTEPEEWRAHVWVPKPYETKKLLEALAAMVHDQAPSGTLPGNAGSDRD